MPKYLKYSISLLIWTTISASQGQWVQTNGPYGGTVRAFASFGPVIFVGTDVGGVFRSYDHGTTWTQGKKGLINSPVRCLAVMHDIIFAGTDVGVFRGVSQAKCRVGDHKLVLLQRPA